MCGIAGFVNLGERVSGEQLAADAQRMADRLIHRGPDDGGVYVDTAAQVALGFRRLSIIDLSREGHQPMSSASGRYRLVFNGEIYNFRELRRGLEADGHAFRGHSDTEVLLAAIEAWGLPEALKRAKGMLALALWDRKRRELSLARDRVGKKPVYYGWADRRFVFGSELKAVCALLRSRPAVNRDALTLLLRHNYIPAPYSIYQGIFKLCHAEFLTLPVEALPATADYAQLERYRNRCWRWSDAARAGAENPYEGGVQDACNDLLAVLKTAVRSRMVADVPLGALLSGGIDSSIVAALMQAESVTPVKTFSIGFQESDYNEAGFAKQVAAHLGTDHTELYVSPAQAMAVIPGLPEIFDEPLADVSQIPTYIVSRLARNKVTVALSGDGGDELFAGYTRYFFARKLRRTLFALPRPGRRLLAALIERVPAERWDRFMGFLGPMLPEGGRIRPGDKLHKLASLLECATPIELYRDLFSQWGDPETVVRDGTEPPTAFTAISDGATTSDYIEQMMQLDSITYLPENILTKVDRASMAASLEVRCPLLDADVIDFAWRLPMDFKMQGDQGKWLLRQLLYHYVPRVMVERPKMGFDVPVGRWLATDLRGWAEDLLDEGKIRQQGFLEPGPIRRCWREHIDGTRNWQYRLWNVLMFQAWLEHPSGEAVGSATRVGDAAVIQAG